MSDATSHSETLSAIAGTSWGSATLSSRDWSRVSSVGLTDRECMQDAVTYAQEKSSNKRDADGQTFYDYEIFGPVRQLMHIMHCAIPH